MQILPYTTDVLTAWAHCLSENEKQRLEEHRKISDKRAAEWLAGRIAAKKAVRDLRGKADEDLNLIEIETSSSGQPSAGNLFVSISHAGGYAAAEASATPVGVDIECFREINRTVYDSFTTPLERQWLESQPNNSQRMICTILLWSLKEAYLKAIGTGLRRRPSELEFLFDDSSKPTLFITGLRQNVAIWYNVSKENSYVVTKINTENSQNASRT